MLYRHHQARIFIIFCCFLATFVGVLYRLAAVQLIDSQGYYQKAKKGHMRKFKISAQRGDIFDRNGKELAISIKMYTLYAYGKIEDMRAITPEIDKIAKITGLSSAYITQRLSMHNKFRIIKRRLPEYKQLEILELKVVGLHFQEENRRFYPNKRLAAHVLGFTDYKEEGQLGTERFHEQHISGTNGELLTEIDAKGRPIFNAYRKQAPALSGHNVHLTIDSGIQHIAESELEKAVLRYQPESGFILIQDPWTGRMLAAAAYPNFNPNNLNGSQAQDRVLRFVEEEYEPGSIFKIVVATAALDAGLISPEEVLDCKDGSVRVAGRAIRNSHPMDKMTFSEAMEQSSNVGMVRAARRLGPERLYKAITRFGFSKTTGVDLPLELGGYLRNWQKWNAYSLAYIPIGQEIAVNSIQILAAYSALASDGMLRKPFFTEKIVSSTGRIILQNQPVEVRRVAGVGTVMAMKKILQGVVNDGTGRYAKPSDYTAAGKTGTAQKYDTLNNRYFDDKFILGFVGFAPVQKAAVTIYVSLDSINEREWSANITAPLFRQVAERVLAHLEIPPDDVFLDPKQVVTQSLTKQERSGSPQQIPESSRQVLVPNLLNMSMRAATRALNANRLVPQIKGSGRVVKQSPKAGSKVTVGSKVSVTFASRSSG